MVELDSVMLSRMLTGMTLIFHVIFATIGVGVPIMISIAEFIGIKKKDPYYSLMAKRWARGFTIIVAVGVVTGTAIGLQLSLLWPSFMQLAGKVIALPLFMETFAFFFEAIFLGAYLYTWDRFKNPMTHWLLSLPIIIGGTLSAFFITTVNAFMNTPAGFDMEDGVINAINPVAAMFNPATPVKVFHVVSSAYMASAAILATIAAVTYIVKRDQEYAKRALKLTVTATLVFSISTVIAGDLSAKFLAEHQPEKLAAGEWHFETDEGADLVLFGRLNEDNEIVGAIRLPNMLSFLAYEDFNAEVTGLDQIPDDEEPPLWIHYFFDAMVSIGMFVLGLTFLYVLLTFTTRWDPHNKWIVGALTSIGPLSMLAIEFGWIYAEIGRQPWILRGFMTVAEGATTSPHVGAMFLLFFLLYFVLGVGTLVVLRKMFRHHPAEHELEHLYQEVDEGGKR